jgi:lysophospholipase L1-like esterase
MAAKTEGSSPFRGRFSRPALIVAVLLVGGLSPAQKLPKIDSIQLPSVPKLRNGSMEWGTALPEDWKVLKNGAGDIRVKRDESVKVDGSAALRISAPNGGEGSVAQRMMADPGAVFLVKGSIRIDGDLQTQIWMQFLGSDGKPVGSKLVYMNAGTRDWTSFETEVSVPMEAREITFGFNTFESGEFWVDRIKFEPMEGLSVGPAIAVPPRAQEQDPVLPYPGLISGDPELWMDMHLRLKRQVQTKKPEVVFIGDSITEMWDRNLWARYFSIRNAANAGIRGDRTNQVLYRIQDGLLDGLSPKLVVLAVGVNNLWKDQYGVERTSEAIKIICNQILSRCPRTRILLVGVFPTDRNPESGFRIVVPEINQAIAKIADGKSIRFVDIGGKFLQKDGSISREVMPDGLHLSPAGYEIYARNIAPVVYSILGRS